MSISQNKPKTLQARIVSGSLVLLSGAGLTTLVNLAYNISVARFLGPTGFGQASAVYTMLTLLSAVTLSFQMTAAKAVAQQETEQEKGAVYRDVHRYAWMAGFIAALLLLAFERGISNYLNLPNPALIALLAVGVAFYIPLGARRGYVQGSQGFQKLAINMVIEGLVRLGGSLAAVLLGFGVVGVIAANAAAMAVSYLLILPKVWAGTPNPLRLGRVFRESSQTLVFFSGQMLINNCDIVLVKHFFASTPAGLYAAAAMVGRVLFALCQAVVNSMVPVVASSKDEERKSSSLLGTALLLVLGLGAGLSLVLRLTPGWVWTTLFGAGFLMQGRHSFPYLLALYAITTVIYCLSAVMITYEMSYKIANTSWVQLLFSGFIIAGICRFHSTLEQVILVQLVLVSVLLLAVGLPLLRAVYGRRAASEAPASRGVRLLRRVSEDEVISEFLKSDFEHPAYESYRDTLRGIVHSPDLENKAENATRRALLFVKHLALWKEIPRDTVWYEVSITEADLEQVRVFPRAQWRKVAGGDFSFPEVMARLRERQDTEVDPFVAKIAAIRNRLLSQDKTPGSVILIGRNEIDFLAIIDGNHRFVSAAIEGEISQLRFLCGLSPRMERCCWYRTNLLTLTRYARNLLSQLPRNPEAELAKLVKASGKQIEPCLPGL